MVRLWVFLVRNKNRFIVKNSSIYSIVYRFPAGLGFRRLGTCDRPGWHWWDRRFKAVKKAARTQLSPGARREDQVSGLRSGGMTPRERVTASADVSNTAIQDTGDGQVETRLDLLDLDRRPVPQQRTQTATMQLCAQRVADGCNDQLQPLDVFAVPVE
jgi:hypothetical protein